MFVAARVRVFSVRRLHERGIGTGESGKKKEKDLRLAWKDRPRKESLKDVSFPFSRTQKKGEWEEKRWDSGKRGSAPVSPAKIVSMREASKNGEIHALRRKTTSLEGKPSAEGRIPFKKVVRRPPVRENFNVNFNRCGYDPRERKRGTSTSE